VEDPWHQTRLGGAAYAACQAVVEPADVGASSIAVSRGLGMDLSAEIALLRLGVDSETRHYQATKTCWARSKLAKAAALGRRRASHAVRFAFVSQPGSGLWE
jgi:hypothetical protein